MQTSEKSCLASGRDSIYRINGIHCEKGVGSYEITIRAGILE